MKRWRITGDNCRVFYIYARDQVDAFARVMGMVGDGAIAARAGRWQKNRIVDDPEGLPKFEGRDGTA